MEPNVKIASCTEKSLRNIRKFIAMNYKTATPVSIKKLMHRNGTILQSEDTYIYRVHKRMWHSPADIDGTKPRASRCGYSEYHYMCNPKRAMQLLLRQANKIKNTKTQIKKHSEWYTGANPARHHTAFKYTVDMYTMRFVLQCTDNIARTIICMFQPSNGTMLLCQYSITNVQLHEPYAADFLVLRGTHGTILSVQYCYHRCPNVTTGTVVPVVPTKDIERQYLHREIYPARIVLQDGKTMDTSRCSYYVHGNNITHSIDNIPEYYRYTHKEKQFTWAMIGN